MFEYIHSSFPDRKCSPEHPIFSEMKSSLKWSLLWNEVFSELFEGVVDFEYIHSSFPDWKRSPEYPIFSEMKSSLKEVFSETRGHLRTLRSCGWLWIHSLFISRSKTFSRVPNLLWNEVLSETCGGLPTLGRHGWLWIHSLFSPESKNVLQSTQSSLKWSLLWNSWPSLNCSFDRPSTFQTDLNFVHLWTFQRCGRDFPDRLEFFSSSNSSNSLKAWLALNYSTGLRLSGSTWIFSLRRCGRRPLKGGKRDFYRARTSKLRQKSNRWHSHQPLATAQKIRHFMQQKWPCILTCNLDTNQVKTLFLSERLPKM